MVERLTTSEASSADDSRRASARSERLLVVGREAGDVAVVRMKTVLDRSIRTKPLLTMFPMGGLPQASLIMPKEA